MKEQYRAYFIGGPDDLTVRIINEVMIYIKPEKMRVVAFNSLKSSETVGIAKQGEYRLLGTTSENNAVYEWVGEVE